MKKLLITLTWLAFASTLFNSAWAKNSREDELLELYQRIQPILDNPTPENPFYLRAHNHDDSESGEAALYLPQSVEELASKLDKAQNWCDILPLHINVKACTYDSATNSMTLYMGRKYYQEPGDAFELEYHLETERRNGYFRATATAEEGPLKTSDYRIELEFINIKNKTFGRIHVSNHISWLSEKAMEVYLSTLGRDKQGIKVINYDQQGRPVYSDGAVAVAERNLVRYYFAFMAYFDNAGENDSVRRYERQLTDWFEYTEQFPQLYELDEQEYLDGKRRERLNQLALQGGQTSSS